MVVNGTHSLRLRTWALRPGRARLIDAGSPARCTVKVFISIGVVVGETGRVREDAALVRVELAERVNGRWDEDRGCGDWRLASELLGDFEAQLVELLVEVEGVNGHWEGTVSNEHRSGEKKIKGLLVNRCRNKVESKNGRWIRGKRKEERKKSVNEIAKMLRDVLVIRKKRRLEAESTEGRAECRISRLWAMRKLPAISVPFILFN
jgi:hypothetical protein